MKISVRNNLGNVDYESNDLTSELRDKFVGFLKENLTKKYGIEFADQQTTGRVDFIKEGPNYGFAFAVSKFDAKFHTQLSRDEFKYNDDIVKKVLKEAIEKFEMQPIIKWDRGHGVFVFNVFV